MSYKKKYLDMVARLRLRVRKLTLTQRRVIVASIMFVLLVLILSIEISPVGFLIEEGKASPRTILAPATVQYVDKAKTRERQDAAAAAVQDVYVADEKVAAQVLASVEDLFKVADMVSALPVDQQQKAEEAANRVKDKVFAGDVPAVLKLTPEQRALTRDIVTSAVSTGMGQEVSQENIGAAVEHVKGIVAGLTQDTQVRAVAQLVASEALRPNLVVDQKETAGRRKAAREAIKPVITTKLEGEVIVSKGDTVTRDVYDLLKSLGFKGAGFTPLNVLFTAVLVSLLIAFVAMYLAKFRRMFYDSPGLLVLLGSTVVVFALAARLLTFAARSWSPSWGFLLPTAAVAIIIAVLFDSGTALVVTAICALITGIITSGNFSLVALALLGGIFPALYASRTSTRHQLRRIGLYTAFWVAAVAFATTALTQTRQGMLLNTGIGFLNGALCTIIAMGSLPFLETTFRVTTNTWLLELAAPDQELLKELSMKAPGTYSHSVMVANLAEAAAHEVGSDPMLARVASYYHDVGKIVRPQFFVENQAPGENPHSRLSPNLSLLIITSHVRDGVELMEKNHFPPDLVEIVKEHHGTSVVRYFYEAALESGESVDVERFRYHYPKPHRRTAGIVMLADAVEATARTLEKPSPTSVRQMVGRIVDEKLADGQLDECSLTFEELHEIKSVFGRILIGTYHPRIDYPGTVVTGTGDYAYQNEHRGKGSGRGAPATEALAQKDGGGAAPRK
ncbi:MAG: HD family phosphohydrolase [Candidatus Geothermincolia bacterium]